MGFLFPKAPKPPPPPNPATPAPRDNPFADPRPSAGSFISGPANYKRKNSGGTSLIGGG